MQQAHILASALVTQEIALKSGVDAFYQVRLATQSDMDEVFELRYQVFFEELGAHIPTAMHSRKDIDEYDIYCDHMVVTHGKKIVGTYRLLPLKRLPYFLKNCYSENEFKMTEIRNYFDDNVLELGRSCISSQHRNGNVARLLWGGIVAYLQENKPDALLGCVSVHHLDHFLAHGLQNYFMNSNKWDFRFHIEVEKNYSTPVNIDTNDFLISTTIDYTTLIPSLLSGYLNLGAKIIAGPAWDQAFNCHDFLILLDSKNISDRYLNYFKRMNIRLK